ncbi:putative F-box/WD repeat-containing protein 9 [Scophthalmus maximus]|uniref:Putative F-box/WD repeat-containing protein 9 n=1 Tax=Scophthalmus maximus TaxID=52904 RepID=A0A2U9CQE1_SCOMX|nr:putative F-box/WD repeat-containing protein 9 [Scophthalmus maximus]
MSEVREDLKEPESGAGGDQGGPCPDTATPLVHEASWPDLQGLPPAGRSSSADISPSPPAETSGLLSLPWEIVTHIASHLPAQCVITVLPKVCHALGIVGKDSTALQLRARRLIGPQAGFPVGPREDFDWPAACLEIEQLITCWKGQASLHKKALECIALPTDHFAHINSVLLIGGEGKVLATGSRDRTVKLWDLQAGSSGTLLHTLVGHQGWVWCLACRGSLLASGGFDSTVRLWDLQAGCAERGLIRAGAAVLCLSCQPDVLLAGAFDKRVSMYDTRVAEPLVKSLCLHGGAVMCLAADDKYIISGGKDCTVSVYDRRAGKGLQKVRLNSYLRSISYSGSEIWAGDNKGTLHSFSMRAGSFKILSQFDVGHTAAVNVIHSSPGSLYTCSSDRTVKVHIPCAPPRTLCTLHYQAEVSGLSVDAGVLAVASGDVCLEVWRPRK